MDQIALIILLIFSVPLTVGLWLIARAISAKKQIEELTQRVDHLQAELTALMVSKSSQPATPTSKPETMAQTVVPATAEPEMEPSLPEPPIFISADTKFDTTYKSRQTPVTNPANQPPPSIELTEAKIPPATEEPVGTPNPPPESKPVIPPPLVPPVPHSPIAAASEPKPMHEPLLEPAFAATCQSKPAVPTPEKTSFEMRLGTFWLVRIGIIILITGLAFAANLAYHNIVPKLGPLAKISLLYLASGLLLGAGAWWQRRNVKESLKNYAQVLFAGGLAAVYFTTYAAHYAPPVRIIQSTMLDGGLLSVWAGIIAWIADRRKSEVMALFAVGLAFFSSVITRVGEFTLYSNLVLTIAAVVFLLRNRWAGLSFASLVASYAGYAFWRFLHNNGWHWASPDENLWLGAAFLAAYWVVFTAATFLSQSERLSGTNRATFLTLNNGAYFALFLLTMLQVHSGGFWKFSLSYGVILLGLAALAKQRLPGESLTKNSYLTQGLVLVTLGFISKFTGLQLALILAAESVVLFVLGTRRPGNILKFFAYITPWLAIGWYWNGAVAFGTKTLWTGLALGAMLAFNAYWATRPAASANARVSQLECCLFTLLAFASWTLATWFQTPEPHLLVAVVLGIESVIFYHLTGGGKAIIAKIAAYGCAGSGVMWCFINIGSESRLELWTAITVGTLMGINVIRSHRENSQDTRLLRAEPTVFTLLALASWLLATWRNSSTEHLPIILAVEAVIMTSTIYLLRIREITLLGQGFLLLAQGAWLYQFLGTTPPWWNPLLVIAVTVGLGHWWQYQKTLTVGRNVHFSYTTLYALAAVAVTLVWLHPCVSNSAWIAVTGLLALAATGYGLVTRSWPLALCGQIFLGVSAWEFMRQLIFDKPDWYFPLVPLTVLAGLSLGTIAWFSREPENDANVRKPLSQVATIYRWAALAMSLLWVWDYVPERQRVWTLMLAASLLFVLGIWRKSHEALAATAVYAVSSLGWLWMRDGLVMDVYAPNLLSLLTLLAMQQLLRRRPVQSPFEERVHGLIVVVGGLSLWRFLSCSTAQLGGGLSVTVTWAGFAVIMLTAGILLHERLFRWFGLGVLVTAVGRVVLVDVWREETIYRVLTFIALGMALLVVGFIYNKYQEKIRQWL